MKTFFLLISICCIYSCNAQKSINVLYQELHQYSITSGILPKMSLSTSENNSDLFYIKELVTSDDSIAQKYGIYQFETSTEDSRKGIIFKRDDKFEFYDISNFEFLLPRLLDFLNDPKFSLSDNTKLQYIGEVINILKEFSESKTNVIIEENHNQFKFFIDSHRYIK